MVVRRRILAVILLVALVSVGPPVPANADTPSATTVLASAHWTWPFDGARSVANPYRAPAHEYGAGHRGVDIVSGPSGAVRAPADGVVAFRGTVVDRPLLTIEHPDGYVSTFEPVMSTLSPGDVVMAGDDIGTVASGGHASPGTMHLGVRLDGDYINPMLLFGEVPRAVLLPCCDPL
ncbi:MULTISPECIES: murein hydrolase activator EnvC family protein [Microbacterium]|uniref:murein hydrolase activator EnvC family protein n=1 Tax=Microbacterium TaxID=33882 RepID=UPI0009E83664|nr:MULTISPECIES: M23 family metallopeptidase [Microbacterium]